MPYDVVQVKNLIHVIPSHDTVKHTTVTPCWCSPTIDPECDTQLNHHPFIPDEDGEGETPDDGKYN